jgi:twinkle protein
VHRPKVFENGERKTEADLYVLKSRFDELGYPCRLAMNYDLKEGRFKSIDYRVP